MHIPSYIYHQNTIHRTLFKSDEEFPIYNKGSIHHNLEVNALQLCSSYYTGY